MISIKLRVEKAPRGIAKVSKTSKSLFIGPTNSAGQGYAWARAVEKVTPKLQAVSMQFVHKEETFNYVADQVVHSGIGAHSRSWSRAQFKALKQFDAVLVESALPIYGSCQKANPIDQIKRLQNSGVRVALLFHGSDLRSPDKHMEHEPDSYFNVDEAFTKQMRDRTTFSRSVLAATKVPVFVSTPDLLDEEFESASGKPHWLPVVVDTELWASDRKPLEHDAAPIVVHAPSQSFIKGSDIIDPILQKMHDAGLIQYQRISGVKHEKMVELYKSADIVVDQVRGGPYGVAACEAMAAGAVVVSHVAESLRKKSKEITGLALPIVEASPNNLAEVIKHIIENPKQASDTAIQGLNYVNQVHDGSMSGKILRGWVEGNLF